MARSRMVRLSELLLVALSGAALALVGVALSGRLGQTTTIDQFVAYSSEVAARAAVPSRASALSIEQIYRLDAPGVVEISAAPTRGGANARAFGAVRPRGSGFVIDTAGHILTNSVVVAHAARIEVSFSGGQELRARVVGIDAAAGVAVLQVSVSARALAPLALGNSDHVQIGDVVVAIGNHADFARTVTAGIVSGLEGSVQAADGGASPERAIETDAAMDRGDLGGPVIDANGAVIGVAVPASLDAQVPGLDAGLGFAIPINGAKTVAAELIHGERVPHAALGISAVALTPVVAQAFNLPTARGLLVEAVADGSAARSAGLRAGRTTVVIAGESYLLGGDIIVAADGQTITSPEQLRDLIDRLAPGDRLSLELDRGGHRETTVVTLH
jgi:S1-C subfamily serine protease